MLPDITPALQDATERTFESLCFMWDSPELQEQFADVATPVYARVPFSGPFSGSLEIHVAAQLLPVLAGNMLGESDDVPESDQYDALGEIANVICGNVLPLLAGNTAVFDLGAPEVGGQAGSATAVATKPSATVRLTLEEGPAIADLYVD